MSRVRDDDIPLDPDEPFGMSGVLAWLRPILAVCCALACACCVAVNARSYDNLDGIRRVSSTSTLYVESLFGRLQIQYGRGNPQQVNADYQPYDRSLDDVEDAWQDSPAKTIGIEWGGDVHRVIMRRGTGMSPVWQVRVRWRTLAFLFAIPPAVVVFNRWRKRRARLRQEAEDAVAA